LDSAKWQPHVHNPSHPRRPSWPTNSSPGGAARGIPPSEERQRRVARIQLVRQGNVNKYIIIFQRVGHCLAWRRWKCVPPTWPSVITAVRGESGGGCHFSLLTGKMKSVCRKRWEQIFAGKLNKHFSFFTTFSLHCDLGVSATEEESQQTADLWGFPPTNTNGVEKENFIAEVLKVSLRAAPFTLHPLKTIS